MTASMYDCWLGYPPLDPGDLTGDERGLLSRFAAAGASPVLRTAREELVRGLSALTGSEPLPVVGNTVVGNTVVGNTVVGNTAAERSHVVIAAPGSTEAAAAWAAVGRDPGDKRPGEDEVIVLAALPGPGEATGPRRVVITGSSEPACLYAVFEFLRRLQAGQPAGWLSTGWLTTGGLRVCEATANK